MLWPVLPDIGYPRPRDGRMHLLQTVVRRWTKRICYWGINLVLLLLLAGCSEQKEISYTQEQLNHQVTRGYLAPQMLTLDFQPLMVFQLYLEKPELSIQADNTPLKFRFNGKLDAQILGGPVTEFLPVSITGLADLKFNHEDQAIFLDHIELQDTQVDLEVVLIKGLIIEQLQKQLSVELQNIPVISLSETLELEQYLANSGAGQRVNIFTFEQRLLFEIEDIQP